MNPLTNVKNITKLSERELEMGVDYKSSWHNMYKDSAWIFVGGLSFDLSEGDIIAVFSQYGEIVNINLVRDRKTGKSRGFAFLCYQDQRSTSLAVDNLNGIKLINRTIRVDHVEEYKVPKEFDEITTELKQLYDEGCAPKPIELPEHSQSRPKKDIETNIEVKKRPRLLSESSSSETEARKHKSKKSKHKKKKHKKRSK